MDDDVSDATSVGRQSCNSGSHLGPPFSSSKLGFENALVSEVLNTYFTV